MRVHLAANRGSININIVHDRGAQPEEPPATDRTTRRYRATTRIPWNDPLYEPGMTGAERRAHLRYLQRLAAEVDRLGPETVRGDPWLEWHERAADELRRAAEAREAERVRSEVRRRGERRSA